MADCDVWSCPACGFRVFNRRCSTCESCGAAIPEALLYSAAEREGLLKTEVARIDAEIERARVARLEAAAQREKQQVKDAAALALAVAAAALSNSS